MLRSDQFDDIYFSADDGLAETHHVFLDNNQLPQGWQHKKHFTICETGFGTGLNFLAAWTLFEKTAGPDCILDYASFELYPLPVEAVVKALASWSAHFDGRLEKLAAHYPLRVPGWHRIDFGRVRLTLVFDDVNKALPRMTVPRGVDAWFLDGFAPAKNPQMWTPAVFENMARLSRHGTTLTSFTAAGLAKDGLRAAGFHIEKRRGYGRKRDMIAGHYESKGALFDAVQPRAIAIIGGGLAGTACAAVLRARNLPHTLYDTAPSLASGASGNPSALFNPRLTARRSPESDFYTAGFALAARTLKKMDGVGYLGCGSLHLITDEAKRKRLTSCRDTWGWPGAHMEILNPAQASAVAGLTLRNEALYLPDSGQVSPKQLCEAWAKGTDVRLGQSVSPDFTEQHDSVIYACGADIKTHLSWLPYETVRGQMMEVSPPPYSAMLKTNLCYGGYIGAFREGRHAIGSTFQKWLQSSEILEGDNAEMLAALEDAVPGLGLGDIRNSRAALRCTAPDRLPLIGAVPGRANHYVTSAHGSYGVVSSMAAAHLIADLIEGGVQSLPRDSVNIIAPQRFVDRAARRGQTLL